MPNMFTPVHLLAYKPLDELAKWQVTGPVEERRDWTIHNYTSFTTNFRCMLSWIDSKGNILSVEESSKSGEEAVYLALEEFKRREKDNAK